MPRNIKIFYKISFIVILLSFRMPNPSVFVVGDSISIEYGPFLQQALAPQMTYGRKGGEAAARQDLDNPQGANGGDSDRVLAYLYTCAKHPDFRPDYLLINCGLHDLKTDPETGEKQVSLARYADNLQKIIHLAAQQKWQLVWITTTPIIDTLHNSRVRFQRFEKDVRAYNAVARGLMEQYQVPVIDLYSFTAALGADSYRDHAHYTTTMQRQQGVFVARQILEIHSKYKAETHAE